MVSISQLITIAFHSIPESTGSGQKRVHGAQILCCPFPWYRKIARRFRIACARCWRRAISRLISAPPIYEALTRTEQPVASPFDTLKRLVSLAFLASPRFSRAIYAPTSAGSPLTGETSLAGQRLIKIRIIQRVSVWQSANQVPDWRRHPAL